MAKRAVNNTCMMEFKDLWDCEEFLDYLHEKGVHCDLIESIITNRLDSGLFINLSESDLKESAPVIGDRICLRKILEEARKVGILIYKISQ